jgi:hypothetical protein
MRLYFLLLVIIFSVGAMPMTAEAATISAKASGSWVNPTTWSCNCVPGASDNIIIPQDITVSVSRPIILAPGKDIVITVAGTLNLTSGSLQLDESDWITILPGGRIFVGGFGGMIFSGTTRIQLEAGSFITGPATINGTDPVTIETKQQRTTGRASRQAGRRSGSHTYAL